MIGGVGALVDQVRKHPIGSRDQMGSYARIAWWQVQSRLASGSVVRNWVAGSKLVVRSGMRGATGNLYFGLYEFADMAFALHLLRQSDLFVDIGANVGVYTVIASKVCGARTIAFEPAVETLPALRANIAVNDIAGLVDVHEVALGDTPGHADFTVGLDCINHVALDGLVPTRRVPVHRLDDLLRDHDPVLIKIDVEGFERAVIAGAVETLNKPSLLAIEIETVDAETHAMLTGAGFAEMFYDPMQRRLSDTPLGFEPGNRLFVRDRAAVMARVEAAPRLSVHGVDL